MGGVLPSGRDLRALFGEPASRPAHEIGREDSELLLEKDGRSRTDLQMVHGEHVFAFFDARFDQLAGIVAVKPAGQVGGDRIVAEVDERAVSLGLTGIETLQGHIEGIWEIEKRSAFQATISALSPTRVHWVCGWSRVSSGVG